MNTFYLFIGILIFFIMINKFPSFREGGCKLFKAYKNIKE